MRAVSIDRALRLPLRLHGIQLGQPVDALLDQREWRVLGFEIRGGDGSERFVPFSTVRIEEDELAVGSALVVLAEIAFYRARSRSFRSLVGEETGRGSICDLLVDRDGSVSEVVLDDDGAQRRVAADGLPVGAPRRAA